MGLTFISGRSARGGAFAAGPAGGGGGGGGFPNTYSVQFDGTEDEVRGAFNNSDPTAYTLSCWFNADSLTGTRCPLSFVTGSQLGSIWRITSSYIWLYHYDTGWKIAKYTTSLSTGTWYHVAATWDGSTVTSYLNGASVATVASSSIQNVTTLSFITGGYAGSWLFDGYVDEAAYWTSALSAGDISDIYNSGTPASLEDYSPVIWWRQGDEVGGSGTTVEGVGSLGYDGTFRNSPTFQEVVP